MKNAAVLSLSLIAGLSLAGPAFGQAIVGYGINVGRAGAAGAASGAGAAGVLGALKGTLEKSETKQTGARQASDPSKPRTEESNAGSAAEETDAATLNEVASETPHAMKTSSGVVISGLPSRRGSGYGGPAPAVGNVPTPSAAQGSAQSEVPAESSPRSDETNPHSADVQTASASPSAKGVVEPMVGKAAVSRSHRPMPSGQVEKRGNGGTVAQESAERIDIPLGTPIEEVMKRFGKPVVSLTGISGEEYTEKYVFQTPGGSRITVLSYQGKVTAVAAEQYAARAARRSQ